MGKLPPDSTLNPDVYETCDACGFTAKPIDAPCPSAEHAAEPAPDGEPAAADGEA